MCCSWEILAPTTLTWARTSSAAWPSPTTSRPSSSPPHGNQPRPSESLARPGERQSPTRHRAESRRRHRAQGADGVGVTAHNSFIGLSGPSIRIWCTSSCHCSVQSWNSARAKIFECAIVNRWGTGRVRRVPIGDEEGHPLPRPCQNHPICVLEIKTPGIIIYGLPLCSLEGLRNPGPVPMMKVSVPTYANPIRLKTLNGKLAGNILLVVRGSDICFVI